MLQEDKSQGGCRQQQQQTASTGTQSALSDRRAADISTKSPLRAAGNNSAVAGLEEEEDYYIPGIKVSVRVAGFRRTITAGPQFN